MKEFLTTLFQGHGPLHVFTLLADLIAYRWLGMDPTGKVASSLHFFIEDTTKIFFLVAVMIYGIGLLRAGLDTDRVRRFLSGKNRFFGYTAASLFGAVTPFCSCSSIPLFLGFTSARIPLGTTMAFLITSPMINEVAVILLGSLLGIRFTIVYIVTGLIAGIAGGFFLDTIKADRHLTEIGKKASLVEGGDEGPVEKRKIPFAERHRFALGELGSILGRIWKWILIGVGLGAFLHGFVPQDFIMNHLGQGQWWSVPAAVLLGIPLYSSASGVIPIIETLLGKGLPIGTAMAFMMSTVAASFPEFMMLKQVMKPRLLLTFFLMLLTFFTAAGWLFNILF